MSEEDHYTKAPAITKDKPLTGGQQYSINRDSNAGLIKQNQDNVYGNNVSQNSTIVEPPIQIMTLKGKAPEKLQPQKFTSAAKFFLKHSSRDLKRRKCHYCLAFCSVFIVVIFSLIVNTIVARGPIIFLKMAEGTQGEIDGVVTSSSVSTSLSSSTFTTEGYFLNYTRVEELYQNKFNLAPRKQFCGVQIGADTTHNLLNSDTEIAQWRSQFNKSSGLPTMQQAFNNNIRMDYKGCVMLWNTTREKQIKVGRSYKYPPLDYGECNLNEQYKRIFDIKEGDIVYFSIQMYELLTNIVYKYNIYAQQNGKQRQTNFGFTNVKLPCKVKNFTSGTHGKFPNGDVQDQHFMEMDPFIQQLPDYLPGANNDFRAYLRNPNLIKTQEFSDVFIMALPEPRVSYYESSDFDEIQRGVTQYANKVTDALGYFPIQISLSLLSEMETYSMAIIFLGLIFDIIILLFIVISILLIHSLLMISVETKTFEIGVMRMVGLSKNGLIFMVFIQGMMFVLPAIVTAFALCFPALKGIYSFLFTPELGIDVKPVPDGFSVLQGLLLGFCIPMISSIIPIRSILTKNLNDALDFQRSKTQAVYIEILDTKKTNITSYVIFGIMTVIYGLMIYYFLPLAMLSLNFSLILKIFFFILVGMLFGLSMLAFNIQRIFEIILTHLLLIFETTSMKMLVLKNLTAHKMRNKYTSIIYSLALGFIIFLIVSYTLQLESAQLLTLKKRGSKLSLTTNTFNVLAPDRLDPVLQDHMDIIDSYAYVTFNLNDLNQQLVAITIADRSRITDFDVEVFGVTPYIFDATHSKFLKVNSDNSGLSLGEQLYTPRGTQGAGMGGYVAKKLQINDIETNFNATGMLILEGEKRNVYFQKRAVFTLDAAPVFTMGDMKTSKDSTLLVSLPLFMRLGNLRIDQLSYSKLLIKMKNEDNLGDYKILTQAFKESFTSAQYAAIKVKDMTDDAETFDNVKQILDIVFTSIIIITMFLCFFSLSSSMTANLYEQSKEIGVMRAIGFKKNRITMLYVQEAFILVISSSLLGIFIGTIIGFTMTIQQSMFTGIPIVFYFPWVQFLVILGITIICAFASTVGPTRSLMKKQISEIFRIA